MKKHIYRTGVAFAALSGLVYFGFAEAQQTSSSPAVSSSKAPVIQSKKASTVESKKSSSVIAPSAAQKVNAEQALKPVETMEHHHAGMVMENKKPEEKAKAPATTIASPAAVETKPAEPSFAAPVKVDHKLQGKLEQGKLLTLTFTLKDANGKPLTPEKLDLVHESKIHLLVVDDSLMDYQHLHPFQGEKPGEYKFVFTPTTSYSYTVWIDIKPTGGEGEIIPVNIDGKSECDDCAKLSTSMEGQAGDLKGKLSINGKEALLEVSDAAGKPVKDLQVVKGAYSHLVGFYTDKPGVIHTHQLDKAPTNILEYGGPKFKFYLEPEKGRPLKLFAQVMRKDKNIFIPFALADKED